MYVMVLDLGRMQKYVINITKPNLHYRRNLINFYNKCKIFGKCPNISNLMLILDLVIIITKVNEITRGQTFLEERFSNKSSIFFFWTYSIIRTFLFPCSVHFRSLVGVLMISRYTVISRSHKSALHIRFEKWISSKRLCVHLL